jgi:carbonic anhydrase
MLAQDNGSFRCFRAVERAVADDVDYLRTCGVVPKSTLISGWVYDVEHGTTERVTKAKNDADVSGF